MAGGRRGGGCALVAVLLLVALGVGFVFADAWARDRAQEQIVAELGAELGSDQVRAEIAGWPFLISIPTNRLEQVNVQVRQIPVELAGRTAIVSTITATASGVNNYTDRESIIVDQLDAEVGLDWAELASLTGLPVRYADPGRVAIDLSLDVLGSPVPVTVEADISVAPTGELELANPTAVVSGFDIPAQVVDATLSQVAPQLKLPTVAGLSYTGLSIDESGVRATLTGTDVALRDLA